MAQIKKTPLFSTLFCFNSFARLSKNFLDNDKIIYSNLDYSFIFLFLNSQLFSLENSHFNLLLALFTKKAYRVKQTFIQNKT